MVLPFGQLYSNLTDKQKQEVKRTTAGAASQVVREGIELYRMFDEPTIEEEQSTEDFLEKLYTVTVGEENVERQQRGDREVVTVTEPETTAGKVIRDISSFTASMLGVGKITKPIQGLKTIQKAKVVAPKTTSLASLTARGEIATQLSINPYEENLANMIGSMIDEDSEGWTSDFERYMLEPIKSSEEKTELENRLGLLSTGLVLTGAFGVASSAITNRKEIAKPFIKTLQNIKEKGTEASEDFVNTVKKSIKLDESRFRKALRKRKEEIRKQKQQLSLFETDESSIALGDMISLKEGLTSKFSTNKIVRNLSNFLAKTFTTRGGRSKMLHENYLKGKYTYEKWEATIDHVGRNLEEAIVNIHKSFGGSREDAWKKVDDILFSNYRVPKESGYNLGVTQDQGFKKALETVPPSAREPLIKARELQDTLSRLLLESDSIPKAAKEKIKEGLGYYVRQSWRLHNDIGYIPTNKAYRDAEAFIEQEIKKQNPNISDDGLTLRLASEMELLAGGKGEFANFGKSFDAFDKLHSGLIKERVNIPPAIKAYLGEIESPTEKLLISMKKISKLVSDSDFHNKAWKDGKNIYFFNEKNQIPGFSHQIPKLAGDDVIQPYGDLSGKYTSSNLARYYTTKYEQGLLLETGSKSILANIGRDIWRSLLFLKSQSQKSKTVRRVNTHIKNVFGGAQISGANGFSMLNPKGIQKSFQAIKGQLSKNTDLENQKYIEKLAGFGILNKNAIVNDLKNLANEASQIKYNPLSRPANYLKNTTAGKKLLKFDEKAQDLYIAEDDLFKINMFETEQIHLNKFNKALPNNVKFDKYKYVDVEQESARLTRNGLPNYDLVPENIKALRAVPFIGRFFSFLSESMRLGITIPNQAFKELALARTLSKEGATKASNIMLKRGIDRAAGYSTFAIGGGYAAANIANYAAGVGYDTINNIRPFLPKWMQNDNLVYSVDEDGTPMIYNVAPWDAFDFPRKPFQTAIHIAANRDLTEQEQNQFWADFFVETLSPFFGESLTQEAINAYVLGRGKDSQGRLLKNPYNPRERFDDTGDTWLENITNTENIKILTMNLVEALEPGTITDFRRFSKTWGKEQTEFDQDIYPKQALARFLTGFGGMPFNDEYVENMYSFKVSNFRKKQSKRRSEIYLAIKDNSTPEIFIKQWLKANRKYYEDYEELHNLTEAAENLDVSTFKVLKDSGVSRIDRISFMGKSRYFNPLSITEEMRLRILESDGLRNNYFDILKEINRQTLILKRLPVLVPAKEQLPKDKEVDKIFEETTERKRKFDGGELDTKQNPVPNVVPEPSERINPYTGEPYEAEMERLGFAEGEEVKAKPLLQRILQGVVRASPEEEKEFLKTHPYYGEVIGNKVYINEQKLKNEGSTGNFVEDMFFGEALHRLKDTDPEWYDRLYSAANKDPEVMKWKEDAYQRAIDKGEYKGTREQHWNESRFDQVVGGFLLGRPDANVHTMRGWDRNTLPYGTYLRKELEAFEKELGRTKKKDGGLLVSIGVAPVSEKQISKLKKSLKKRQAKREGGEATRNYAKEYDNYHSSEKQKKDRAHRNNANRKFKRDGKIAIGDGKDVDHKDGNPRNNSPSNLTVKNKSSNRSFSRRLKARSGGPAAIEEIEVLGRRKGKFILEEDTIPSDDFGTHNEKVFLEALDRGLKRKEAIEEAKDKGSPARLKKTTMKDLLAAQKEYGKPIYLGDSTVGAEYKIQRQNEYFKNLKDYKKQGYYNDPKGNKISSKPDYQAGAKSFHTKGQAIDLNRPYYQDYNRKELKKLVPVLGKHGFIQDPNEEWHFSQGEQGFKNIYR